MLLKKKYLSRKLISLGSAIKRCAVWRNLFECVADLFLELETFLLNCVPYPCTSFVCFSLLYHRYITGITGITGKSRVIQSKLLFSHPFPSVEIGSAHPHFAPLPKQIQVVPLEFYRSNPELSHLATEKAVIRIS